MQLQEALLVVGLACFCIVNFNFRMMAHKLWAYISRPWSYFMVLRLAAGSRLRTAEKLSMAALVVALSIFAKTTNPVVRSTSVRTDERLPTPLIKSASQYRGMRRSSTS